MTHLHWEQNSKRQICDCDINIDHMDSSTGDHNKGIAYWTRKNMYHPWMPVTIESIKEKNLAIYPVWLKETEKDQLIAHWEKTGMFGSIIEKIHSAENTKGIR